MSSILVRTPVARLVRQTIPACSATKVSPAEANDAAGAQMALVGTVQPAWTVVTLYPDGRGMDDAPATAPPVGAVLTPSVRADCLVTAWVWLGEPARLKAATMTIIPMRADFLNMRNTPRGLGVDVRLLSSTGQWFYFFARCLSLAKVLLDDA